MNRLKYVGVILLALQMLYSCKGLIYSANDCADADTVVIESFIATDTVSFKLSDGSICKVFANANIQYPKSKKDMNTLKMLQKEYAYEILGIDCFKNVEDALKQFLVNKIKEYDADDDLDDDEKDDYTNVYRFVSKIDVKATYNRNDLLSFCKEETTIKNGSVTMVSHTFINFDTKTAECIDLNKIIADNQLDKVAPLLKEELISMLHVNSETELIELGYFNLDNLIAHNNFYITEEGVTWCYSPYEIACFSVGETFITLNWDKLKPYLNEQSSIKQIIED